MWCASHGKNPTLHQVTGSGSSPKSRFANQFVAFGFDFFGYGSASISCARPLIRARIGAVSFWASTASS